jgi:hypothetical protein
MKLTRNCVMPWCWVQIHAGGLVQTCPCPSDTEIGDWLLDVCEAGKRGRGKDLFHGPALRGIRRGLLSGNLRRMCRDCAFAEPEPVPAAKLQDRVGSLLGARYGKRNFSLEEMERLHAYEHAVLSLTNRCQLRCIYCNQSTCAETNPFFKAEFPEEFVEETFDALVALGITRLSCSTEGEATIYPGWHRVFSRFHQKYPHIQLLLTTNLSRKYSEEEFGLLAAHHVLEISCDTLDESLYKKIRVNGNLPLVLENVRKLLVQIEKSGTPGPQLYFHPVVCNLTWRSLEPLSEYAFSRGIGLTIGNYEERSNAEGHRNGLLRPVFTLPQEEREELAAVLARIKQRCAALGLPLIMYGNIMQRVKQTLSDRYNRFSPFDDNPLCGAYHAAFSKGTPDHHLDIVYDAENCAHFGITAHTAEELRIENIPSRTTFVWREIYSYKNGSRSPKLSDFGKETVLGYRKKCCPDNGVFVWKPLFRDGNVASVMLEATDWWGE